MDRAWSLLGGGAPDLAFPYRFWAASSAHQSTRHLQASALPQAVDNAWSSLGGGPSDLTFPDLFLGTWRVQATLTKVETPLGPDFVPDMKVRQQSLHLRSLHRDVVARF